MENVESIRRGLEEYEVRTIDRGEMMRSRSHGGAQERAEEGNSCDVSDEEDGNDETDGRLRERLGKPRRYQVSTIVREQIQDGLPVRGP